MENKEMKNAALNELNDDALELVIGGMDSKTINQIVISNTVPNRRTAENINEFDFAASGFEGEIGGFAG